MQQSRSVVFSRQTDLFNFNNCMSCLLLAHDAPQRGGLAVASCSMYVSCIGNMTGFDSTLRSIHMHNPRGLLIYYSLSNVGIPSGLLTSAAKQAAGAGTRAAKATASKPSCNVQVIYSTSNSRLSTICDRATVVRCG